ncbi:hypothetical protein POTOM_062110 [Populus tomentosa]|uniref:ABC-type xenobiotic transporter n=1 Tax=Populus tomentosa TaxID=118781 RepID=A0A8X7XLT5_POPTO|nr:hypothetical protein POTOM_062110 [Populus tomentosa]
MSLERSEHFLVRFTGKNYSAWAFQFQIFVKGKELWGHIAGTIPAPDSEQEKEKYVKWEVKDAQIMSWILGSMEHSMLLNLKPYKSSREMWDYLKKVYNQSNTARRFQLELELGQLSQGSMSIQEFYSSFVNLWAEYTDIVYASVPLEGLVAIQSVHETSKRDQFLMKLRGEFEAIRSNLMNREPVPFLDICVGELLREEQRIITQAVLEQKAQNSTPIPVAYAAQGRSKGGRNMSNIQCYSCKGFGHIATTCTKKFCNYCKKPGHIIKDCSIRPPKKSETAYNVSVGSSNTPSPENISEFLLYYLVNSFILKSIPVMATVISFGMYTLLGGNLTPARAFTSLSLFAVLRFPLSMLPNMITQVLSSFFIVSLIVLLTAEILLMVVNANVSLKRLEELFLAEERIRLPNPLLDPWLPAVSIKNGYFSWDSKVSCINYSAYALLMFSLVMLAHAIAFYCINHLCMISSSYGLAGLLVSYWEYNVNTFISSSLLYADMAERHTLSNINLDVPIGSLVAVVGSTGEGKTSLVSAMLGELPATSDASVFIRGTVAYVPQVSCIFNATLEVRDNILFGSPFDPARYEKAIDVTALQHDLDLLPGGDLAEIGERGVNISGGQKQRVSMARAVYSNSDVYIFDDPLSALDAHVGRQRLMLWGSEHCIWGGVLIGLMFTPMDNICFPNVLKFLQNFLSLRWRIKLENENSGHTNQLHFLSQVDRIILVHEGTVKEEGTFEDLSNNGMLFRKLMGNAGKMEEYEEQENNEIVDNKTSSKQVANGVMNNLPKNVSGTKKPKEGKSVLIKQEERETGVVNLKVLTRTKDKILLVCSMILAPMFILSSLMQSTAREVKRLDSITRSPVYAQFGEALNGLSTIRAYKAYDRMASINGKSMDNNVRYTLVNMGANRWLAIRLETLGGIMIWFPATFAVMQNGRADNQQAFASTMGLLLKLERGRILIDDCDIAKFGLMDLRKVLGIIPQSPVLFSVDRPTFLLFRNRPTYNDGDLWEALERAHSKMLSEGIP